MYSCRNTESEDDACWMCVVPIRSSCRVRAYGILRRDVLTFAQLAASGGEIFNLGSHHPNGGSRVIS